jgi:hypothetical protein
MIKVKIPSVNEPQWNKTPKQKNQEKAADIINLSAIDKSAVKSLKAKNTKPMKSASSSKVGPGGNIEKDKLSKSKSTSKVQLGVEKKVGTKQGAVARSASSSAVKSAGAKQNKEDTRIPEVEAEGQNPDHQQKHLQLSKCLSGDNTLLLSATGDNVLSQADTVFDDNQDTFPDADDEDDLISDEEVPDLEDAYVTAVSGYMSTVKSKKNVSQYFKEIIIWQM